MAPRHRAVRANFAARALAGSLLYEPASMTRFDRFWEPFLVIVAGLMIFIGTL